ncbi:MAG: adenylyl-sulfate kinase [Nitrospirae bacterium]|nr:adenylyl-sulfate kinase [Nitrospirota bacterium]
MAHSETFAIWITGLPASGKSTIVASLRPRLEALGLRVEVLESDAVRRVLTPAPTYSLGERDLFYRALAFLGSRLVMHGVTVIFDATANRRAYRDFARGLIPPFMEVAVECPLEVCQERDRKGTYRKGLAGESTTVPGLQDVYEPPLDPDVRIDSTRTTPETAADQILAVLRKRFHVPGANRR